MRAVVQRVKQSSVKVDGKVIGHIQKGFNVLIGISSSDTDKDLEYIKDKLINLRVFEDENNKMNLSIKDIKGEMLIISQFTLYGDCRKGRRPNFMQAMMPGEAEKVYDKFIKMMKSDDIKIETGIFGADMEVNIVNDGPVTLIIDSSKTI